jgi:hypothetical protein
MSDVGDVRLQALVHRKASSATCRASVAGYGQSREKQCVRGEPAGYELGEGPHPARGRGRTLVANHLTDLPPSSRPSASAMLASRCRTVAVMNSITAVRGSIRAACRRKARSRGTSTCRPAHRQHQGEDTRFQVTRCRFETSRCSARPCVPIAVNIAHRCNKLSPQRTYCAVGLLVHQSLPSSQKTT